jgi:hypothetical protein
MFRKLLLILITCVISLVLIFPAISCGGGISNNDDGFSSQLVADINQAKTDGERQTAIRNMICQSLSLGYIDEIGDQLNQNLSRESVSLTAGDVAVMSYFVTEGQGYTIKDIIDYVSAAGFVLSSTGQTITTQDILPDIQKYVDWSYAHKNDPRSALGLALSSGPDMRMPITPPIFQAETRISNTAGLMMLADLLVGIPEEKELSSNLVGNVVYAAGTELQGMAEEIKGLITLVEAGQAVKKLGSELFTALTGVDDSTAATTVAKVPTSEAPAFKVPDLVKKLVEAFATGSYLSVRLIDTHNLTGSVLKSIELTGNADESYPVSVVLIIAPSGQIISGGPVTYTMNLINEYSGFFSQGGMLFPDADAFLESAIKGSSTGFDGHRLGMATPDGIGKFYVMADDCSNTEHRSAILHASADITIPSLDTLMSQNAEKIEIAMRITNKSLEDVKKIYSILQRNIKITPWVCTVIIPPASVDLKIVPGKLTGDVNKQYTFIAQGAKLPDGYRYEWRVQHPEFSGKLPFVDIIFDDKGELNYTFPKDGIYIITLRITNSSGQIYGEASAQADIGLLPGTVVSLDIEGSDALETLQSYNFIAKPNIPVAQLPPDTAYKWDFGDGTTPVITAYSTERFLITPHIYIKNGDYEIKLSLIDKSTQQELAVTTKKVTVNDLNSINKTNHIRLLLGLYGLTEGNGPGLGPTTKSFGSEYFSNSPWTFEWVTPTTFKGTFEDVATTSKGIQTTISEVTGTISISAEGVWLENYTYKYKFSCPNYDGSGNEWESYYRVQLRSKRIPLTKLSGGENPKYYFSIQGTDVAQYITESAYQENFPNGQVNYFLHATWDNLPGTFIPTLEITLDYLK